MFLAITTVVFYIALAVYLLVTSPSAKDVARVVAGVCAAVIAVVLALGL